MPDHEGQIIIQLWKQGCKQIGIALVAGVLVGGSTFSYAGAAEPKSCESSIDALRQCYQQPVANWPAPALDIEEHIELGLVPKAPPAEGLEKQRQALGKRLFFEPLLSGSGQISCSSCHRPEQKYSDGLRVPVGHNHQRGSRNTPGLLNVGLKQEFFWDGRAKTLAEQAAASMTSPIEMAADPEQVVARLAVHPDYSALFAEIYGDEPLNFDQVTESISAWVGTLRSRQSPFDRFLAGKSKALSDSAVRGLHLFRTKARCMNCHQGPLLSDGKYHNLGLTGYGGKREDLGRYLVTGNPEDVGRFKTPSLRDISSTGPYFHWGTFSALHNVLSTYNAGGYHFKRGEKYRDDPLFPSTSELLQPLGLTDEEFNQLESFLYSLSSDTRNGFSLRSTR
ncbi:MAG: cytochrome-c peroxidase [Marinobacter sp.]|uniref:cytochrome-c peroxidase n=1 Tax=Marinobacter sp. TaxID=50741 RepID=UPI003F988953